MKTCLFIFLLAFFFFNQLISQTFTVNDIIYMPLTETLPYKAAVTSKFPDHYRGDLIIPEEVSYQSKIYTVSFIEASAFQDCIELMSVEIPNSITSVNEWTFFG